MENTAPGVRRVGAPKDVLNNILVIFLDRDSDDYDLITKTKALYRFAMNNYHEPGRDLLLQAIRAFEAAEDDRNR